MPPERTRLLHENSLMSNFSPIFSVAQWYGVAELVMGKVKGQTPWWELFSVFVSEFQGKIERCHLWNWFVYFSQVAVVTQEIHTAWDIPCVFK